MPNQSDSTIRYKSNLLPIALEMHLKRVVPEEVLFYEVSEKFADGGKLIFEIKPPRMEITDRSYTPRSISREAEKGEQKFSGDFSDFFSCFCP